MAITIQTVGRLDYGHQYLNKLKEAEVPMTDNAWGEMSAQYIVENV